MGYIGRGLDKIANVEKLDNITFNGGTTYALTKSSSAFTPNSANSLLVSIDGVIQQGNFTVSTTNIVFDFSPTSANTCNFIMHYGVGVINIPADNTITSAKIIDDAVTTDKLANSINSAITANTSKTTNATHSGEVTGATALTIADNIVDEANLKISNSATNGYFLSAQSSNSGGLTWAEAGGGITEADTWRVNSNFQGNAEPIASNWEREDTDANINLGTGLTESSGIFTFPSTGVYEIIFVHNYSGAGDNQYIESRIDATTDNSSYSNASKAWGSAAGNGVYGNSTLTKIIDVTNTTNTKVRFSTTSQDTDAHTQTASDQNLTYVTFKRIGDT